MRIKRLWSAQATLALSEAGATLPHMSNLGRSLPGGRVTGASPKEKASSNAFMGHLRSWGICGGLVSEKRPACQVQHALL